MSILLKEQRQKRLWEVYTATVMGAIGMVLVGKDNWKFGSYLEMAYPNEAEKDTRSAEEIKQDILKRLKE